jgi:DNA-dependent RNA polymerase auxiliary subunit epsilon
VCNVVLANADTVEDHQDKHHPESMGEHYRWGCNKCQVALFQIPRHAEIYKRIDAIKIFYYNDKVVKPVMFHDCIHRLQRVDRLLKALKYSPDNRYHIEDVFGKSDDHFDYEDEMESIGTSKIGDNDGIKVLLTANEDNLLFMGRSIGSMKRLVRAHQ